MLVTTVYKPEPYHINRAKQLAEQLDIRFVERNKDSIRIMKEKYGTDTVIVVKNNEAKCFIGDNEFFFHPSTSEFRIKRLIRGDNDVMVEACNLRQGDSILDCTLGLSSDAIVASHAVGETGRVVGIESESFLSIIIKDGLKHRISQTDAVTNAMRRVEVINSHHDSYLKSCRDNQFDVVYFDPMFREKVEDAAAIDQFRTMTNAAPLTLEAISEARRVARNRVVLKERTDSGEFHRLGFVPMRRPSSSTTYGIIVCEEEHVHE